MGLLANIEVPFLEKINLLESEMMRHKQVELQIKHYFAKGLYAREMTVPAGTLISGLVHRTETIGILTKGSMLIWREDGTTETVIAPFTHTGKPGVKRIGYAKDEVVWTTFHQTELTDLDKIEEEQFETTGNKMFDFSTGKVANKALQDNADYSLLMLEYNLDETCVRKQSENTDDIVDIPPDVLCITVAPSEIEGLGVFPTKSFKKGDIIGFYLINRLRTQLGRYINHSCEPNGLVVCLDNNDKVLIALRDIDCEEVTTDYRYTLAANKLTVDTGGALWQE